MKKIILIVVVVFCLFRAYAAIFWPKHIFSPKPECTSHPFENQDWEDYVLDKSYQKKIGQFLQEYQPDDFRYFRETFIEEKEGTSIIINLRNKQHCFHALFKIENFEEIDKMVESNGQSWPEELYDVQWKIKNRQGIPTLIFTGMAKIID